MFKRLIALALSASMLLSLGFTVNAEEVASNEENKLYCLTNNNWTEADLALYQERAGFVPEN